MSGPRIVMRLDSRYFYRKHPQSNYPELLLIKVTSLAFYEAETKLKALLQLQLRRYIWR